MRTEWRVDGAGLAGEGAGLSMALMPAGEHVLRFRCRVSSLPCFDGEETFVLADPACPADPAARALAGDGCFRLETPAWRCVVRPDPFLLELQDPAGRRCLATAAEPLAIEPGRLTLRLALRRGERIYGLGQDPMARLDQTGGERDMWQEWGGGRRSGNAGVPFYFSSNGYGLLLNSSYPSRFAIGAARPPVRDDFSGPAYHLHWAPPPWPRYEALATSPEAVTIVHEREEADFFLFPGGRPDDLLRRYHELTGFSPLPPRWALGFIQCRNRYRNQAELLRVAREFRRRGIPGDVLVIDWLWFKEFGDLDWFREDWPDPAGMLAELRGLGFRVMQAQHPFIDKESANYAPFREAGFLNLTPEEREPSYERSTDPGFDHVKRPTFDHSNPEARRAFWQKVRRLYDQGIRGYWTDMGELEVHPPGTAHHLGPRERVHNIYSLLWAKGLYEHHRAEGLERPLILARTAYAGMQRYAWTWSGDINGSWQVLRDQVRIGQGACLSGIGYWTTDIGGFIPTPESTPELYVRWLQWGCFNPAFRTHGTRPGNEPWSFGAEAEAIVTGFIRLRYRLLPYIYSCAWELSRSGRPIMRAMCLDFADDPQAVAAEDQFMFGPALLVAPITEHGARARRVYLPAGVWYDFWTGERLDGGGPVEAPAPLARIPVYVRAGSIIPMAGEDGHGPAPPAVHVYTGADGRFSLYDDDGATFAHERGDYGRIEIAYDDERRELVLRAAGGDRASGMLARDLTVAWHGVPGPGAQSGTGADGPARGEEENFCLETWPVESGFPERRLRCKVNDEPAPIRRRAGPRLIVDGDMDAAGCCRVHALVEGGGTITCAELEPPPGWEIAADGPGEAGPWPHHAWTLRPDGQALPLVQRARIAVRCLGAGTEFALRGEYAFGSGWCHSWSVLGHLPNPAHDGLLRRDPVEEAPELPGCETADGRYDWRLVRDFNCHGYLDFQQVLGTVAEGVAYAKTRVWSPSDRSARLELAAEPGIRIWLNAQEVFAAAHICLQDVYGPPLRLARGWNTLLVKVARNGEREWGARNYGFMLRLVDGAGEPCPDLLYAPG
ncbi:MAG: TIM-barrel domain-containing protein [Patescibacteria group bacterium]